MKLRLALLLSILCIASVSFSQNKKKKRTKKVDTIYYFVDSMGYATTSNKAYAIQRFQYKKCKRVGQYLMIRRSDQFVLESGNYDENGQKSGLWKEFRHDKSLLSESQFDYTGDTFSYEILKKEYYKNGNLKSVEEQINDTTFLLHQGYLPDGTQVVKDGNGTMSFYDEEESKIESEGEYINGLKNGLHKFYVDDKTYEYDFKDGVQTFTKSSTAFMVQPVYPGEVNSLRRDAFSNFKTPRPIIYNVRSNHCEHVITEFVVNEKGEITEVKFLSNNDPLLYEEAKKALYSLKNFKPAQLHGEPMKVSYVLPFVIQIR